MVNGSKFILSLKIWWMDIFIMKVYLFMYGVFDCCVGFMGIDWGLGDLNVYWLLDCGFYG